MPALRFPEFAGSTGIDFLNGNLLFESINQKNPNTGLPVLAITQDQGAVPREQIDYNVTVTEKSLATYKVVERGDFIISLRSFQGGIEYSQVHGICSPAYIVLRKKSGLVFELYYKHYFKTGICIQNLNRNLEGIRDGKMISYHQFSSVKLPFPNLREQEKVAQCLSSADDLIAAEQKKLELLKRHKKGLAQKLFPAEGQALPEWRFPQFQQSGEWEQSSIGSSCEMFSGGTPDTSKQEYYGGGIPFIRSAEIGKSATELSLTEEGLHNSSAKLVKKGDLLIALYGANSGEAALAQIDGAINQAVLCLRHKTSNAFVYHYLSHIKNQLISRYIQGGQGNLSGQLIKAVTFYIPKPEEQEKIAGCLSALDALIAAQADRVENLKTHKRALAQRLFPVLEEADI